MRILGFWRSTSGRYPTVASKAIESRHLLPYNEHTVMLWIRAVTIVYQKR